MSSYTARIVREIRRLGWLGAICLALASCAEASAGPDPASAGRGQVSAGGGDAGSTSTVAGGGNGGGETPIGPGPIAGSGGAGTSGSGGGSAGGPTGGMSGSAGAGQGGGASPSPAYPPTAEIIEVLERVNQQFSSKWPDPAKLLPGSRPSNIWTRAVYFEGLLALHQVAPRPVYQEYALDWAEFHDWSLRSSVTNADNQCAAQVYFDLFELDGKKDPSRISAAQQSLATMLADGSSDDWTWVDAIQMSMPVWAQFAMHTGEERYFTKMHALYAHTKNVEGGGLYDVETHLWWRDALWKPNRELTPSGKGVYWSRGNGWVFAALARVLDRLPPAAPNRSEYESDFRAMAGALASLQRSDGFWNPSLMDPSHFGGPETTGTSLFVYGMAWGIRTGLLSESEYGDVVRRAWQGMLKVAVREDGFLGFVQSTGEDPSDGQPLTADKVPDFEDYGVGCFLLAGSELARLGQP